MAESSPIQTNFSAGELTPRLNGRVDFAKYYDGASTLKNFEVLVHGGITKRSGTRHIAEIKTSTGSNSGARLIPFVFSKTQAYILEFGHNYIRFYKDEGQIYSSGTTAYELTTTYTAAQIDDIEYVQSADTMWLVHPDHIPRKLTRTAHTTWTITDVTFVDGPYLATNTTTTTMTPSATGTGSRTFTASASTFASTDVGRSIRYYDSATSTKFWGWGVITAFTSATVVTVDVKAELAGTTADTTWRLGAFHKTPSGNYPTKVTFYEERLFYSNTDTHPNTIWGSMSSDFDTFSPTGLKDDGDGTVSDDNAVTYTITSDQVNEITSMYGGKHLHVFTKDGTFNIYSGSATTALTPSSIQADNETKDGAANVKVIPASKAVLFIGKNKKRLREFAYNIDYDSYTSPDLTVLSEHLGFGLLEDAQFANYPNNILWCRRGDGALLGMTYDKSQDITAWHQHQLGGRVGSATITVSDYANISVGTKITVTKANGDSVIFTSEASSGAAPAETLGWRPNESNNTTADNIYTAINAHADFTVANPAAAVVTVTETTHNATGLLKISTTDSIRLATTNETIPEVKSMAVIPGISDLYDTLYILVQRTVDGATVQYVEFMEEEYREDDGHVAEDAFFVDSGLTYSGSSVTSVSGLDHLEGQTVKVLNNGAVESDKIVSSGAITLSNATTKCHVGLGYDAELETVNMEPKSQYGTTQGKRGRIDKVIFRVYETVGLKAGPASTNVSVVPFRTTTSAMTATTPKTGDYEFLMPSTYSTENKLYVKSDTVQPCTISALMIKMSTYD